MPLQLEMHVSYLNLERLTHYQLDHLSILLPKILRPSPLSALSSAAAQAGITCPTAWQSSHAHSAIQQRDTDQWKFQQNWNPLYTQYARTVAYTFHMHKVQRVCALVLFILYRSWCTPNFVWQSKGWVCNPLFSPFSMRPSSFQTIDFHLVPLTRIMQDIFCKQDQSNCAGPARSVRCSRDGDTSGIASPSAISGGGGRVNLTLGRCEDEAT